MTEKNMTEKKIKDCPILDKFYKLVHQDNLDPELADALYQCRYKWRNQPGHIAIRYRIIDYATLFLSLADIARMLNVDPKTVKECVKRFMEHGLEGLQDKPRSGRPPKAKAEKDQAEAKGN